MFRLAPPIYAPNHNQDNFAIAAYKPSMSAQRLQDKAQTPMMTQGPL